MTKENLHPQPAPTARSPEEKFLDLWEENIRLIAANLQRQTVKTTNE